jgi:hypothetical protein
MALLERTYYKMTRKLFQGHLYWLPLMNVASSEMLKISTSASSNAPKVSGSD